MCRNFKLLSVAPKIFKALAWITVILGGISASIIFVGLSMPETPRWMGLITLIIGAMYFFIFSVISEIINLLLEMNARIK